MTQAQFVDSYVDAALLDLETCVQYELCSDDRPEMDSSAFSRDKLAPQTLATINAECTAFYAENAGLWQSAGLSDAEAGYCFYHSRNGAGVGFWDRDEFTAREGNMLTSRAHAFGITELYIGDDGLIYQFESRLGS